MSDSDVAVATISVTKIEEVVEEGEGETIEGEAAEPEVLTEKKDDASSDAGKEGKG